MKEGSRPSTAPMAGPASMRGIPPRREAGGLPGSEAEGGSDVDGLAVAALGGGDGLEAVAGDPVAHAAGDIQIARDRVGSADVDRIGLVAVDDALAPFGFLGRGLDAGRDPAVGLVAHADPRPGAGGRGAGARALLG